MQQYRVQIKSPAVSTWITVAATSERTAKARALSPDAYRYGWEITKVEPVKKEIENAKA